MQQSIFTPSENKPLKYIEYLKISKHLHSENP